MTINNYRLMTSIFAKQKYIMKKKYVAVKLPVTNLPNVRKSIDEKKYFLL